MIRHVLARRKGVIRSNGLRREIIDGLFHKAELMNLLVIVFQHA